MSTKDEFVNTMERMFGSDAALGVYFELEDGSMRFTLEEHEAMANELGDDMPGTISFLRTGGSAVCCTDFAGQIFMELPGRVKIYGFANEENPTSQVVRQEMHPSGHDFAVVDNRYIVDPWPRLVHGAFDQLVFDMQDDAAQVLEVYGPFECWTHMVAAEEYEKERVLQAA